MSPPAPGKVTVVAWDVCHNAVGRAYMLADVLARDFCVEVAGARFKRYGGRVWPPIAGEKIPVPSFAGRDFPGHIQAMRQFASKLDGDVLLISKPRLPALALAALALQIRPRPVVLDVDDHETAFFPEQQPLKPEEALAAFERGEGREPFGEVWTRCAENFIELFRARTVSNRLLQKKFGGEIIPHVRDEKLFDPRLYDRRLVRKKFGFSENDRVVLFLGTPRRHKGLVQLKEALAQVGGNCRLCLIGNITDPALLKALLSGPPGLVRLFPSRPFSQLPESLMLADAVCLLQDKDSPVSRYQLPAKFVDALAMGVPVLATPAGPMEEICRRGLAEAVGEDDLVERLGRTLEESQRRRDRALSLRKVFLEEFSYQSVRPKLRQIVQSEASENNWAEPVLRLLEEIELRSTPEKKPLPFFFPFISKKVASGSGLDLVFFWKQNDSSIYGRRQDMITAYLAASARVRRVIHFDAPISLVRLLWELRRPDRLSHGRLVVRNTLLRAIGSAHQGKIRRHSFIYLTPQELSRCIPVLRTGAAAFSNYVGVCLERVGVDPRRAVFYVWPAQYQFPDLVERLRPGVVVADLVDDQRAFYPEGSVKAKLIEENLQRVLALSDVVLANSPFMVERAASLGVRAHLVPNGVELQHPADELGIPPDLATIPPPRLGYSGNLSSRLDLELLEFLVRQRPDWNFVFIGSAHLDRRVLELRRHKNVHFLGVRPYPEVRRYIKHFDVALLPHARDRLSRSMHPLKVPLYLALGVPVAATDVENLGNLRHFVETASEPPAFLAACERLLAEGRSPSVPDLRRVLMEYDWSRRAEEILQLIESAGAQFG